MIPKPLASIWSRALRARSLLTGPDRKPPLTVARELLAAQREGRSSVAPARFYLDRLLFLADAGPASDYLTGPERDALWDAKRRSSGWYRASNDKVVFDEHFRRADRAGLGPFPLPDFLGQTRAGFLLRPAPDAPEVRVEDAAAFAAAFAEMAGRSPSGAVFAKPVIANQGSGAVLLRSDAGPAEVEALRQEALATDYVFQEAIRQHPDLDRLYAGSLNTLRILVGRGRDGRNPVLSVVLRLGRNGRAVDNSHAGGLVVGVDRETGRLRGPGGGPARARTFRSFGAETFAHHPDTGVSFEGFTVPLLDEALALTQRAQDRLPILYVGWDVGLTPSGPVLIEANEKPYLQGLEAVNGGFWADPVIRAFLEEQGLSRRPSA